MALQLASSAARAAIVSEECEERARVQLPGRVTELGTCLAQVKVKDLAGSQLAGDDRVSQGEQSGPPRRCTVTGSHVSGSFHRGRRLTSPFILYEQRHELADGELGKASWGPGERDTRAALAVTGGGSVMNFHPGGLDVWTTCWGLQLGGVEEYRGRCQGLVGFGGSRSGTRYLRWAGFLAVRTGFGDPSPLISTQARLHEAGGGLCLSLGPLCRWHLRAAAGHCG